MSEVPPESHDEARGGPFGPPPSDSPPEKPASEPVPAAPPEQPLRGPFDDLFSERTPSEMASSDPPPRSDPPRVLPPLFGAQPVQPEPQSPFGAQPASPEVPAPFSAQPVSPEAQSPVAAQPAQPEPLASFSAPPVSPEALSPFGVQPAREEPIRTPWHPPALGGDERTPLVSAEQQQLPLGDPYAGAVPPFGAYGQAAEGVIVAPPPRRSVARPAGRLLRELAETVILALVIFLLVRAVVQNFQVEGKSMEPSLQSGWYLLVDKALYWEVDLNTVHKFLPFVHPGSDPTRYLFRGPKRGDIIVFVAPDQVPGSPERDFIKRVIGLPGDTIEVKSCTVYVNGKPLAENYIQDAPAYTYPTNGGGPVTVPKGQYFVLGDNRNNSSDSHSWGFVPKQNIIGQAWVVYWPFHNMGFVKNVDIKPGTNTNAPAAGSKLTGACSTPR